MLGLCLRPLELTCVHSQPAMFSRDSAHFTKQACWEMWPCGEPHMAAVRGVAQQCFLSFWQSWTPSPCQGQFRLMAGLFLLLSFLSQHLGFTGYCLLVQGIRISCSSKPRMVQKCHIHPRSVCCLRCQAVPLGLQ